MRNAEQSTAGDWWVDLYDELLAESLLVRDGDEHTTVAFLVEELALPQGARVFDQCCGIGSLAIPLASRGFDVVGVDQAQGYIDRAIQEAMRANVSAQFEVGDAFEFVTSAPCHGAMNWWTSYGYAGSNERNHRMLARAFESLHGGGRFALDVPNLPGVLRHFEPDRTDVRETPLGRIETRRESKVDLAGGRLLKRWTFRRSGEEPVVRDTSLALAMPHDHITAMESVGFRIAASYANVARDPLSIDSPRCILVAERPQ